MELHIKKDLTIFLLFTLLLSFSFIESGYGQQLNKIFEDIGGGSGNTTTTVESDDNTTLYVVGGIIVAGIVVYALLRDKKEKPTKDTTATILNDQFLEQNLTYKEKVKNLQSQIPINFSFGMQQDKALKDERRYFFELAYNF